MSTPRPIERVRAGNNIDLTKISLVDLISVRGDVGRTLCCFQKDGREQILNVSGNQSLDQQVTVFGAHETPRPGEVDLKSVKEKYNPVELANKQFIDCSTQALNGQQFLYAWYQYIIGKEPPSGFIQEVGNILQQTGAKKAIVDVEKFCDTEEQKEDLKKFFEMCHYHQSLSLPECHSFSNTLLIKKKTGEQVLNIRPDLLALSDPKTILKKDPQSGVVYFEQTGNVQFLSVQGALGGNKFLGFNIKTQSVEVLDEIPKDKSNYAVDMLTVKIKVSKDKGNKDKYDVEYNFPYKNNSKEISISFTPNVDDVLRSDKRISSLEYLKKMLGSDPKVKRLCSEIEREMSNPYPKIGDLNDLIQKFYAMVKDQPEFNTKKPGFLKSLFVNKKENKLKDDITAQFKVMLDDNEDISIRLDAIRRLGALVLKETLSPLVEKAAVVVQEAQQAGGVKEVKGQEREPFMPTRQRLGATVGEGRLSIEGSKPPDEALPMGGVRPTPPPRSRGSGAKAG